MYPQTHDLHIEWISRLHDYASGPIEINVCYVVLYANTNGNVKVCTSVENLAHQISSHLSNNVAAHFILFVLLPINSLSLSAFLFLYLLSL